MASAEELTAPSDLDMALDWIDTMRPMAVGESPNAAIRRGLEQILSAYGRKASDE